MSQFSRPDAGTTPPPERFEHTFARIRSAVISCNAAAHAAVTMLERPDCLSQGLVHLSDETQGDLETIRQALLGLAHRAAALSDADLRIVQLLDESNDGGSPGGTAAPPRFGERPTPNMALLRSQRVRATSRIARAPRRGPSA